MGTVLEMIGQAAKRTSPTTTEIIRLSSGGLSSTSKSRTPKTTSTSKRSPVKSSRSPRAKASCKYGPRGADGYCPKKPRSNNPTRQTSRNRTRVTGRTPGSATSQAIDVVTNPRATTTQKMQAVEKVAEATASSAVKSTAKRVAKSAKWQKAKAIAVDIARRVPVGGVGGPFVSAAATVLSKMPSPEKLAAATRARARADAAVRAVESDLKKRGQKLSRKERNVLLYQHIDYFLKHP